MHGVMAQWRKKGFFFHHVKEPIDLRVRASVKKVFEPWYLSSPGMALCLLCHGHIPHVGARPAVSASHIDLKTQFGRIRTLSQQVLNELCQYGQWCNQPQNILQRHIFGFHSFHFQPTGPLLRYQSDKLCL